MNYFLGMMKTGVPYYNCWVQVVTPSIFFYIIMLSFFILEFQYILHKSLIWNNIWCIYLQVLQWIGWNADFWQLCWRISLWTIFMLKCVHCSVSFYIKCWILWMSYSFIYPQCLKWFIISDKYVDIILCSGYFSSL